MNEISPLLWLRAETKPGEARTPLVPEDAEKLIAAGFELVVEASSTRAIDDNSYRTVGARIVEAGQWQEAPQQAFILGLKELPEDNSALLQRHIFFAHAYKEQQGWQDILTRFRAGGELLDLEYLLDPDGRRVAAFGYWAGFAGACLAVLTWCGQATGSSPPLVHVGTWPNKQQLIDYTREQLQRAYQQGQQPPRLIVIGAGGRVGQGAGAMSHELGLETTCWDMAETQGGGPFEEILSHDIFLNCVLVNRPLPPFINQTLIEKPDRQLSVIADISCDPFGEYNPIPLYTQCTTFAHPTERLIDAPYPLDLIAIDNLPSLLPLESSQDFSRQLLPALLALSDPQSPPWSGARNLFNHHTQLIEDH